MQPSSKRWGAAALLVGGAAFGAAFLAFLLERSAIAAVNGWWQDELYAIYASDPAEPLSVVFLGRILAGHHAAALWLAALCSSRVGP
jgi:hypothetical protein